MHEKDWRCRARVTPARSPWRATSPAFHACGSASPFRALCCHRTQKPYIRTPNPCCITAFQSSCIRRRGGLLLLGALFVPYSNAATHARLLLFVRMCVCVYLCEYNASYEGMTTLLLYACLGITLSRQVLSVVSCADIGYSHVSFAGSRSACSLRSECSISFSRQWCVC